jgi:hypothetical protein
VKDLSPIPGAFFGAGAGSFAALRTTKGLLGIPSLRVLPDGGDYFGGRGELSSVGFIDAGLNIGNSF